MVLPLYAAYETVSQIVRRYSAEIHLRQKTNTKLKRKQKHTKMNIITIESRTIQPRWCRKVPEMVATKKKTKTYENECFCFCAYKTYLGQAGIFRGEYI